MKTITEIIKYIEDSIEDGKKVVMEGDLDKIEFNRGFNVATALAIKDLHAIKNDLENIVNHNFCKDIDLDTRSKKTPAEILNTKMFLPRIAFCKVSSFSERGAEHSYGRIYLEEKDEYDEGIELTFKLTEKQAIYLNKKNQCGLGELAWHYEKGQDSYQFDSDEEVHFAAKKYLADNNLLDQYDFLLEGDFGSLPCHCIWSRDEAKQKVLNDIYDTYEKSSSNISDVIDEWKDKAIEFNIVNKVFYDNN